MAFISPDALIAEDNWSDLSQFRAPPEINIQRMHDYRIGRIRQQMIDSDIGVLVMVNPISMRYAVNYRSYGIFSMHIPSAYLIMSCDAPFLICNGIDPKLDNKHIASGQPISYFYGGDDLSIYAERFVDHIEAYLLDHNIAQKRVALEYINPSIVQSLEKRHIDVVDGVGLVERARLIKNTDEVNCIKWSVAVAEHGAMMVKQALKPGVSEQQLWGILNYTNLANDGDWHEGRMLASGPRINPWLQEASSRKLESGDLVGFDTDMVGPYGYCADLSRTFHCGPTKPTNRQKQLYQLSVNEIEHNLNLIKAGASYSSIQQNAFQTPMEFRKQAYPCVIHGVGMCDEYPHLHQGYREPIEFDNHLQQGMVICVESYIGAVGEPNGVKLEQQVLVTEEGYELLSTMPYETALM